MAVTKIQWANKVWNPTTGCSRVSPGCDHCYAMTMAHRIQAMGTTDAYDGTTRKRKNGETDWTGVVHTHASRLMEPFKWTNPTVVFVDSMSDLFHPTVPFDFIDQVFAVMALNPHITFQVLTKRPEIMAEYLRVDPDLPLAQTAEARVGRQAIHIARERGETTNIPFWDVFWQWPLPNVWLGTSVENRSTAIARIPHLSRCPALVRFLSMEPLLECVYLNHELVGNLPKWVHWVIIGGESGPGARPFDLGWARVIIGDCKQTGIPVFVKQLGSVPIEDGKEYTLSTHKGGDMDEWPPELRIREMPKRHQSYGRDKAKRRVIKGHRE